MEKKELDTETALAILERLKAAGAIQNYTVNADRTQACVLAVGKSWPELVDIR